MENTTKAEDRSGGFIESLREKDAEIAALLRAVADHATVRSELAERVKSLEEDRIALVKAVGESSAVLIRQRDEAYEIVLRHEVRLQASDKEIERRKNRARTIMEDAHGAFHEAVKGWPGVEGMHTIDECADPAAWIRHVARQRDDLAQKVKELERERWNCHECGGNHPRPVGKCPDAIGDPRAKCEADFHWKLRGWNSVCGRNKGHGGDHSWYNDCGVCKGTAGEHEENCTTRTT